VKARFGKQETWDTKIVFASGTRVTVHINMYMYTPWPTERTGYLHK
jgi:hypothetical protein